VTEPLTREQLKSLPRIPAVRTALHYEARLREVEGLQNDAELWLAQERAVRGLLAEATKRAEKAEARVAAVIADIEAGNLDSLGRVLRALKEAL
jgi:hypothetical protein